MRVIAGTLRSRPLVAPEGIETRPTTDRLRETLFNVLTNPALDRVAGAGFLDLYAGSGAVGIEALSRGAAHVFFVEQAVPALAVLKRNLESLGIRSGFTIEKRSVAAFLRRESANPAARRFGVVFLDPPYDSIEYELALGMLGGEGASLLAEGALVIAEHRKKEPLPERFGTLRRFRLLRQGDAGLSFYGVVPAESLAD